ncbi:transmembrane emp24 domain-containing protein p24delta9-like protein, partial [Tanacetum coccineum]
MGFLRAIHEQGVSRGALGRASPQLCGNFEHNVAAQVLNHDFFWESMQLGGGIFELAEDVARPYDEAARLMCGPRARTNFLCNPNMQQSSSSKLLSATLTAGLHICYMMQIFSPLGNNCNYADQKEFGTYAFTANEDGNYMVCFMVAKQNPPAILTVEFDWRSGLATKDWSKVAKRGQLE